MNRFLVLAGVFLVMGGFFELFQGKGDWWIRSLQGFGIALAGVSMMRQQK